MSHCVVCSRLRLYRIVLVFCLMLFLGATGSHSAEHEVDDPIDLLRETVDGLRGKSVYAADELKLMEAAIRGMLRSVDPYARYYSAKELRARAVSGHKIYGSTGLDLIIKNGVVVIVATQEGGPAAAAGLQSRDIVTHVGGKPLAGMEFLEVGDEMRGEIGTSITLKVMRPGRNLPFDVTLERVRGEWRSVRYDVRKDVGYMKLRSINSLSADHIKKALGQLRKESSLPLKGYVLDLRDNFGGPISKLRTNDIVELADVFLGEAEVFRVRGRDGKIDRIARTGKGGALLHGRLVVLINGGTAGGTEALAGALQDNRRAKVVGTRSFRYGSVPDLFRVGRGGMMSITVGFCYTPSGRSIEHDGIEPDIVVAQGDAGSRTPKGDVQLHAALELARTGEFASEGGTRTYRY